MKLRAPEALEDRVEKRWPAPQRITRTRGDCYVFSTGSTPDLSSKPMKIQIIESEENRSEIDFSLDCNIAKGA